MVIIWILCSVPLIWYAIFRYRRRRMYKIAALIKASKLELPFIGILHQLSGTTEEIMTSLQRFSYEANANNGIIKLWSGPSLFFVITNPRDLELLLKTCLSKDEKINRLLRNLVGNGGIFAPVSIWRLRRKILVPAFSPRIIENFVEVFSEQSEILAKRIAKYADNLPFSLWPYLSAYTLDAVCETSMGVQLNTQSNHDSQFLKVLNLLLNLICERIFHAWLQIDWIYRMFVSKYTEHQKSIKIMHDFTDQVIQKKRKEIQQKELKKGPEDETTLYRHKTLLESLISLSGGEKGYSDVELREEMLTLLIAGTDTSAVTIGYSLQLLGKYPDVQEKVFQELCDVFGDSDKPPVKEDLMRLSYLERVIKESLRLFPPVPFIGRKVLQETTLPSGVILPAGSGITVSIWGIHRDPAYWGPDAEQFDPDRFLPERFNLAHTCSYMPFSSGPRNCVGYQYALMSVKTALSSILRRYRVAGEPELGPRPSIPVKLDIMMKAVDGFQLVLEKRRRRSYYSLE